jgi:hypothetical protein
LSGRLYLHGKWFNEREGVRHDGEQGEQGRATVLYAALEVDSVISVPDGESVRVFVKQDGKWLTRENGGLDVKFDDASQSSLLVDGPRRYNIVCNREFGEHELSLSMNTPGAEIYTFSFVTGVIPELVSAH